MTNRMMIKAVAFSATLFFALLSCVVPPPSTTSSTGSSSIPASATQSGPRTILLDGEKWVENQPGKFISWYCVDFVRPGPVLVEIGYIDVFPGLVSDIGFILFDGSYTGTLAYYQRVGLNHRWDWGGEERYDFAFIVEPDGTGLFIDFSSQPSSDVSVRTSRPSHVFRCYKYE